MPDGRRALSCLYGDAHRQGLFSRVLTRFVTCLSAYSYSNFTCPARNGHSRSEAAWTGFPANSFPTAAVPPLPWIKGGLTYKAIINVSLLRLRTPLASHGYRRSRLRRDRFCADGPG
jgi:hypothetical protein